MIWTVAISLLGLMALSIPVGIVLFLLGIGVAQFYSAFPLLRGMGQTGGLCRAHGPTIRRGANFRPRTGQVPVAGTLAR